MPTPYRWPRSVVEARPGICVGLSRLRLPLAFNVAEVPDGERHDPGRDEDADDDEAGPVDVEFCDQVPEPTALVRLLGNQAEDLDGTDEQGDEDGQARDGEVVIDLADGLRKGPVVGEVHEAAVDGVEETHAGGEE